MSCILWETLVEVKGYSDDFNLYIGCGGSYISLSKCDAILIITWHERQ